MEVPKGFRRVKVHLKRLESNPLISDLDLARKEPKINKYDLIEHNLIDIPELIKKVNEFKCNHIKKEHNYSLMPSKEDLGSDREKFQELKELKKNIKEESKAYSSDDDFFKGMASDSWNEELLNYEWCLCKNGDLFMPITRKCQSCHDYYHLKCFYSSHDEFKCLFCVSSDESLLQNYKEQREIRKKFKNEYKNEEPASPSSSNLVDLKIEIINKENDDETKLERKTNDTRKKLNSPSLNTNESLNKRGNPKRKLVEPISNQNSKKISKKDKQHDCDMKNKSINSKSVSNTKDKSESKSLNKSETETCTNKAAKPNSENSFAKSLCNIV